MGIKVGDMVELKSGRSIRVVSVLQEGVVVDGWYNDKTRMAGSRHIPFRDIKDPAGGQKTFEQVYREILQHFKGVQGSVRVRETSPNSIIIDCPNWYKDALVPVLEEIIGSSGSLADAFDGEIHINMLDNEGKS